MKLANIRKTWEYENNFILSCQNSRIAKILAYYELYKIAIKNKFISEKSKNFTDALKKISSREKKLIVCFGSLYNCGNILNKN